jgi:DNA polymerase-1
MDSKFTINHEKLGTINVHYITGDGTSELEKLKSRKVLGWDSETTYAIEHEANAQAGLDPYLSRIRLSQFATENGDVYLFDHFSITPQTEEGIRDLLESVSSVKIAHNAKFDVKMARHHLGVRRMGKLFCTEIGYRLNECGTYEAGKVSLNNAVHTYLKFGLEKELQKSDWSGELTKEQLTYAAIDARVLVPLRKGNN